MVVRGDTLAPISNCSPPYPKTLANGYMQSNPPLNPTNVTFYCNSNYYISGPPVSRCYQSSASPTTYYWDHAPIAICMELHDSACRTITAAGVTEVACASNEMVVSGSGQCGAGQQNWNSVLWSAPSQSMQSWVVGCEDGSLPTSLSVRCCKASVDSFARPPPTVVAGTGSLPFTPSGNFFTNCSLRATALNTQNYRDVICPADQSVLTGGGGCVQGTGPLLASYRKSDAIWSVQCNELAAPTVAICCNVVSWSPALQQQSTYDSFLGSCVGTSPIAYGWSGGDSSSPTYQYSCIVATMSTSSSASPACPSLPQPALGSITVRGYQATLSCPPPPSTFPGGSSLFHIEGASVITCNGGQWSGPLGVCSSFDASQCLSVRSFGANTLSCPNDGQQWVMMNPSVSCNVGVGVTSSWPALDDAPGVSTWSGTCSQASSEISALCCLASATPALSTCYAQETPQQTNSLSGVQCKAGQFALTAGIGQCANGIQSSTVSTSPTAFTSSWQAECVQDSAFQGAAAVCCDLTPLLQSTCWTIEANTATVERRGGNTFQCPVGSVLISSSVVCPGEAISSGYTNVLSDPESGSTIYSHDAYCVHNGGDEGPSAHYGTCCSAPQLCGITTPDTTHLLTPSNTKWLVGTGSAQQISCKPGYSLDAGGTSNSFLLSCYTPQTYSVQCFPQQCDSLPSDHLATFSASTVYVGDSVIVTCPNDGHFPSLTVQFTCTGQKHLNGGGWQPYWDGSTPLCQQGVAGGNVTWTAVDHYSFTVAWAPVALPLSVSNSSLHYNVLYSLVFPAPAQLDSSNAQESGLISPGQGPYASVQRGVNSLTINGDVNGHIEGIFAVVTIQAVAALVSNSSALVVVSSSTVQVQEFCGCDMVNNPKGLPLNLSLAQSLDASNGLTLTFTPQSLCAKDYKVQQLHVLNGSAVWLDVALPVLQTYWAETQSRVRS